MDNVDRKKPTGFIFVSENGTNRRVQFPSVKSDIEDVIATGLVKWMAERPRNFTVRLVSIHQNIENANDFAAISDLGPCELELVEYAPLDRFKGSYQETPHTVKLSEIHDDILSLIGKKHEKYGGRCQNILLCIYVTHAGFNLPGPVIAHLKVALAGKFSFAAIYFCLPLDENNVASTQLTPQTLTDLDRVFLKNPLSGEVRLIMSKQTLPPNIKIGDAGVSITGVMLTTNTKKE